MKTTACPLIFAWPYRAFLKPSAKKVWSKMREKNFKLCKNTNFLNINYVVFFSQGGEDWNYLH